MESKVFLRTINRAGINPAIMVVAIKRAMRKTVPETGATRIPSLKGKSIGCAAMAGWRKT